LVYLQFTISGDTETISNPITPSLSGSFSEILNPSDGSF